MTRNNSLDNLWIFFCIIIKSSLESELALRAKKHEMQLTALTENLATLRSEIRIANEKLSSLEQIKSDKAGLFTLKYSCVI